MTVNKHAKQDAKQVFRSCFSNGNLDEALVPRAVQRIASGGHRGRLAVLSYFYRLVRLDRAQHTANVESAAPLPSELQGAIEGNLRRRYGPGLTVSFSERPSLIGGMRVQVGSDVYDGTVLAKLIALEKRF
ncbi:MAG TPA: F0F1 ATP synthase subunit delta [Bryobacteraceae bacterium]|jgi:F-type H+-transporting ATPase subunit delta